MTKALNQRALWRHLNYNPHKGQRLVHASTARFQVLPAGRRTGKSVIGGRRLTAEALYTYTLQDVLRERGKRREFWIVGPEYSDSEKEFRVIWDDLERLEVPFDHPGSYNNAITGQMQISLWGGRFLVTAKSAKFPGTLVGEGLSGVILAEAAKLKGVVWYKYLRPTLADERGWALFTSTPEGKNWFYELYMAGKNETMPEWESWRMPSWINRRIFPLGKKDPEIESMKGTMTDELYAQEVMASFTDFAGRVFKLYDDEIHVVHLPYDPTLPLYLAADYGWTNPFVVLFIQVDVHDNVYVIGEFRTTNHEADEVGRILQTYRGGLAKRAIALYGDPAGPEESAALERLLHVKSVGGTGGETTTRLNLIRKWLRPGPLHLPYRQRLPKLYIDYSCNPDNRGLIYEMNEYKYPDVKAEQKGEAKELPLKKDDHGPEALGRFFKGHFGTKETKGRATQSRARVSA